MRMTTKAIKCPSPKAIKAGASVPPNRKSKFIPLWGMIVAT